MKLLAINFGGLGDEVLFLPTLKSIKLAHPDWQITLLTEPRGRAIKQLSNCIDENIVFDIKKQLKPSDYFELVSMLRKGRYDIVVSSGSSSKVSMLLFLTGIAKRIGYHSGGISKLLLTNPIALNRNQYAAWMYHDLVKGLDIQIQASPPSIDLDQASLQKMSAYIESALAEQGENRQKPLILIHPGMSKLALDKGIIKTWASANWAELIKKLNNSSVNVILCGGPDDAETIAKIQNKVSENSTHTAGSGVLLNAFGKTSSIQELVGLMELADMVVCVDSAPMHIAMAMRRPVVALFGPTDPAKLFLASDRAVALRDPNAELVNEKFELSSTAAEEALKSQSEPSVQIPLDTVFQTVMDQLNRVSSLRS